MNSIAVLIFMFVATLIGSFSIGIAVKSFRRRDYFIGGLSIMSTFWIMLLIARTFFEVL